LGAKENTRLSIDAVPTVGRIGVLEILEHDALIRVGVAELG
tara:strand:- start:444 stop:566 length:123 start_codon:yes stop_codon:yes gene_type:complete